MASTKAAAGELPAEALKMLQPLFEQHASMRKEYDALHSRFDLESTQRRQLYNRLMEYQGNIRVFCRCRPMLTREVPLIHTALCTSRRCVPTHKRLYRPRDTVDLNTHTHMHAAQP